MKKCMVIFLMKINKLNNGTSSLLIIAYLLDNFTLNLILKLMKFCYISQNANIFLFFGSELSPRDQEVEK